MAVSLATESVAASELLEVPNKLEQYATDVGLIVP